ncbi:MAG: D-aminoacyl-tRNA deacylase [bacterium]|nr:D-aminoacyl-tRNA deacylase [bacterium]
MKSVVQRVRSASITIDDEVTASIGTGILVLIGITHTDTPQQAAWMAEKLLGLRVFADEEGRMNKSVSDIDGEILVVSQFTLYGDTSRGTRPSFINAAPAGAAEPLYNHLIDLLKQKTPNVSTGTFGAMMDVALVNDGPVTIILDRENTQI